MVEIDRRIAEQAFARLPLTTNTKRFCDLWISNFASDGGPVAVEGALPLPDDLASSTLVYEVRPGLEVICRLSGECINRALGMSLVGREMLSFMPPESRETGMLRYARVALGGMQLSYRKITTAQGNQHVLQEIGLPHPDRRITPVEPSAAMSIVYVDVNPVSRGDQALVSQGALRLTDDPEYVSLRPSSPKFDIEATRSALEAVNFTARNRQLANYWLSLWQDGILPARQAFNPRAVPTLLAGICIFDVTPEKQVICRLAGSAIRSALGLELTNVDWLAQLEPADRPHRLKRFTDLTRDSVARSLRRAVDTEGRERIAEEILLPFGDVGPDGARQVITHSDWRPSQSALDERQLSGAASLSVEYQTIPLVRSD